MKLKENLKLKLTLFGLVLIIILLVTSAFGIFILYYANGLTLLLALVIIIFAGGSLAYSLVKIFISKKYDYLILLLTSILCFYILFYQPLRLIGVSLDYNMYKTDREKLVNMIENDVLKYDSTEKTMTLPDEYSHLSKYDAQVLVEKEGSAVKVCFFTTRGIWKAYPAFIYLSDNAPMSPVTFNKKIFTNIKKLDEHWYWANMTNGR